MLPRVLRNRLTQERIVLAIAVLLFAIFCLTLNRFATSANLLALVRGVSVLGILGIGMGIVVIGRGIDLSVVSTMAISVAWFLDLVGRSVPLPMALALGLGGAILIGCINGLLIAYAEVPALFATLAIGTFVYGIGRSQLLDQDLIQMPASMGWFTTLGSVRLGPVPIEILLFAGVGFVTFLFLRFTKLGRYIYLIGDNYAAARITGVPARPVIVGQYMFSSLIAFIAGAITASSLHSVNTRIVNSTLLYDVILVVVIGGIGLSGGKGGIRNVVVGTLLIGIMLNGMTILDIPDNYQNLIKAVVLLIAIVVDSLLNPRDEQTAQQGDI
jgi:ribose transport system permease protein